MLICCGASLSPKIWSKWKVISTVVRRLQQHALDFIADKAFFAVKINFFVKLMANGTVFRLFLLVPIMTIE
jgi:hypothetical protein